MTAALSAPLSAFANTAGSPTPPAPATAPATAPAPAPPVIPAPPAENPVRIGLGWNLTGAELLAAGGLNLVAGGALLGSVPPGQPAIVKLVDGKIQVNGLAPVAGPVRILPGAAQTPNYVGYRGRTYRGEVELVVTATGRLSVVNLINLEEYLLGVVPNEMTPSWPGEALKAQAVAARTYALANRGKWKAEGYDLRSNTDDQAYGGAGTEYPSTSAAVVATKGQVITYGGRLVATYYFSSSGGHTENNENIWTMGSPVPYLRGVPDFDNLAGNKYFTWSYQFTLSEFTQKLMAAGYSVGNVISVTPGTAGPSGRPIQWTVAGSGGQKTLTMQQMRTALGLPSSARAIAPQSEGGSTASTATSTASTASTATSTASTVPVSVVGADGRVVTRQVGGSYVVGAAGTATQLPVAPAVALGVTTAAVIGKPVYAPTPAPAPPPPPPPAQVVGFEAKGGGHGHGVGLSQWGAHGMALQGKSYTAILTHFYTGTKVETR